MLFDLEGWREDGYNGRPRCYFKGIFVKPASVSETSFVQQDCISPNHMLVVACVFEPHLFSFSELG